MKKLIVIILGAMICAKACAWSAHFSLQLPKFKPPKQKDIDAWREEFEAQKENDILFSKKLIVRQNEKRYRAYMYYVACDWKCGNYKGK
jgi:hypothetical protein